MKNKPRINVPSSDKLHNPSKSKSKDKNNLKKHQYYTPCGSSKNSLSAGSPRAVKHADKCKKYIQFLAANKRSLDPIFSHEEREGVKNRARTPTHKRNSSDPFFPNKKSTTSKLEKSLSPTNKSTGQRYSLPGKKVLEMIKSPLAPFNSNKLKKKAKMSTKLKSFANKTMCDLKKSLSKGKISKQKCHKGKKKSQIQQQSTANKTSIESNNLNCLKLEKQQEKLRQKLFKGIQFYRDLGKGAHALVRSAVDWPNKRKIAIKIYEKTELTEEELTSIERQIQVLHEIEHPSIVKLYEIIETFKTINLVMQYGGGNSLSQFIKAKPKGYLQEQQAKLIFKQILECVEYLQKKGITHRDIKAENILLNKHLQLKLIDFGFSLICKAGLSQKINSYCGTPTYMAPEVVSKIPHSPLLSDRWSLGVLLFLMLNGRCPFRAASQKQLFVKINQCRFQCYTEVSVQAKDLLSRFLVLKPQDRLSPSEALKHPWLKL